jgi:hypothetical protein
VRTVGFARGFSGVGVVVGGAVGVVSPAGVLGPGIV